VTPAGWRLARQIEAIITAESGASLEELSGRTGGSFVETRATVRALYRMRRTDFCWGYAVAVPRAGERRRAA
jgi:hypothetical protein